jgi:magnesium-transporting ATPase (P-type)
VHGARRPAAAPGLADPTRGLDPAEAAARLATDGPNELPPPRRTPTWRLLFDQLVHFFAVMLWVAGGLAFVAGMPQLGVAIFVVIVVNGVFAFAQEQRAAKAAERLRDLLPVRVTVRRGGETTQIDATELVLGDVVLLSAGDRVAADLAVLDARGLAIDESTLTGESVPVAIDAEGSAWAGTFVVGGEGTTRVVATGGHTRLAGIATMTSTVERPPSPLARELSRIVRTMAALTVGVGAAFFGICLLVGTPASDGFLFAVGVTVALVPEGLLPTVTLSLAMGAQRMAGQHALVRHLQAVETLGSTTFICTDKTGTLTRNEMAVVEVWTTAGRVELVGRGYEPTAAVHGSEEAIAAAATATLAGAVASQGRATEHDGTWVAMGDPMEAAIDACARRLDQHPPASGDPSVDDRHPFDPDRRRASVAWDGWLVVKGAPDALLPRCTGPVDGADDATAALASRGLRVLAVARRPLAEVAADATADEAERGLELLGLVALQDPPREGVAEAVAACRSGGIRLAMITGDHPATATAIARQIGLVGDDPVVLVGDDLPADDGELGLLLDHDGVVVSRVAPEQKMRIARALQARGHVVAMTGDGVNDGPALREADIGVAMGRSGTDVAREAADLVLLDDHFSTIVSAVEEGRATFTNIRRFLTYHLTDNVAELAPFVIWALSGGKFPLAIGVLQVLCLDIATDLLPALALGAERPGADVLARPLRGRHVIDPPVVRRVFGLLGPVEATVEMTAFVVSMVAVGWRPGAEFPTGHQLAVASGAAFSAVVLGQAANAFACRSATRPPWQLGWATNRLVVGAVAVQVALLAGLLWIGPIARLLDHAPPSWPGALVAAAAFPAVLLADAIHKRLRHRRPAR